MDGTTATMSKNKQGKKSEPAPESKPETVALQITVKRSVRARLKVAAAERDMDMGKLGEALLGYALGLLDATSPPKALLDAIKAADGYIEEK